MSEAATFSEERPSAEMPSSQQNSHSQSIHEIHKNGWLKIYPYAGKKSGFFSKQTKAESQWVVFCIHNDQEALLELYENRRKAGLHRPSKVIPLSKCLHLSPSLIMQDNQYIFTITLDYAALNFATASREQMNDWMDTIKNKLIDMRILNKENIYSEEPASNLNRPATTEAVSNSSTSTISTSRSSLRRSLSVDGSDIPHSRPISQIRDPASPLPAVPLPAVPSPAVPSEGSAQQNSNITVIQVDNDPPSLSPATVFNFDNLVLNSDDDEEEESAHSAPIVSGYVYEALFNDPSEEIENASSSQPESSIITGAISIEVILNMLLIFLYYVIIKNVMSKIVSTPDTSHVAMPSPRPQLQRTLKEEQVMKLQREIAHRGGIRITLRKKDCLNGIAFIEYFGAVWVAGWKQRDHPFLHNTFHIGDHLISIAGLPVRSLTDVHKLIKRQVLQVEMVLRRVPLGVVIAIKREYDGQDLGLIREGNTAEIKEVIRGGLAARHGLPLHAKCCEDSNQECRWVLTEINNRPLNLFFKDGEVEARLNAVGKDISVLVQPLDLVKALKKQLKSLRNGKDYLLH
ncbi:hypothetical protein GQR58_015138 [Nymphon striatum]|nr:hypothetical protein GQR58_015138 [Nymphon striatum]